MGQIIQQPLRKICFLVCESSCKKLESRPTHQNWKTNCLLVCKSTKDLAPKKFDTFAPGEKFGVMICFLVCEYILTMVKALY
jgi:hypothetical protein